jgi:hypothetical protein
VSLPTRAHWTTPDLMSSHFERSDSDWTSGSGIGSRRSPSSPLWLLIPLHLHTLTCTDSLIDTHLPSMPTVVKVAEPMRRAQASIPKRQPSGHFPAPISCVFSPRITSEPVSHSARYSTILGLIQSVQSRNICTCLSCWDSSPRSDALHILNVSHLPRFWPQTRLICIVLVWIID